VRLDDPLGRWLPPHWHVDAGITVRQLLNHTSGLANYTANAALGAAIDADPARIFAADDLLGFRRPTAVRPRLGHRIHQHVVPPAGPGRRTRHGPAGAGSVSSAALGPLALSASSCRASKIRLRRWRWRWPAGASTRPSTGCHSLSIRPQRVWAAGRRRHHCAMGTRRCSAVASSRRPCSRRMRALVPAAGNILGETGPGLGIRSYEYLGRTQFGTVAARRLAAACCCSTPTRA